MSNYVCAFRGRRDSYQVPLALAEAGLLDRFYTDAYSGPLLRRIAPLLPASIRSKIEFRRLDGLPDSKIRCLWPTTIREHLRHRLGCSRESTYLLLDRKFSEASAKRARKSRASLLLYSSYAWEAFQANYTHEPRRVLFQYHPHPEVEARLLAADRHRFASILDPRGDAANPIPSASGVVAPGDRDAWRSADLVICASTFTRRSLISEGLDPRKCVVIPYGIDSNTQDRDAEPPNSEFKALFVGSGVQRKGLHHLLLAWSSARLPGGARLTLVCRNIEAPLARLAASVSGVELIRGTSADSLRRLYASSHLFAMPSLVEGFGQVYLESLAQGCPVLGTENTCLPDLGDEREGVFVTAAGEIDPLVAALESLAGTLPGRHEIRASARSLAERWTWPRFRKGLIASLSEGDPFQL